MPETKVTRHYTVAGTQPVKVDNIWRQPGLDGVPGESFSTTTDVQYLVNIGALTATPPTPPVQPSTLRGVPTPPIVEGPA